MEKFLLDKGIIYYTDNRLEDQKNLLNIATVVRNQLIKSGLPIVSCSLKYLDFGINIVLNNKPSVVSMWQQILTALNNSKSRYVFFCEHDVLYHQSHFDFTPIRDDTFYYNTNVWRCHLRSGKCITYDELRSASGICVSRELAIDHYTKRLEYVYKNGFNKIDEKNPNWARTMGYEPGKKRRNGGFRDEKIEDWRSKYPNIDIRHYRNLTALQFTIESFNSKPKNWQETTIDKIPGWNYKSSYPLII